MSNNEYINEPTYGGSFHKTVYFDLEKGDNVFRILPSLKKHSSSKWAVYHKVHWGYTLSNGGKKPFLSPEVINFQTKMVEVPDAALNRIKQLESIKAAAKLSGDTATLATATEALKKYSLDKKWYMNVMNLDGTIGVLKIPHKCKAALDEEIKRIKSPTCNPVGIEGGRYFVFRKTGEKLETLYNVMVYKETVDAPGLGKVEKEVNSNLSEAVLRRMDTEAADLEKLYKPLTSEQVERIVKEGSVAMDEFFPNTRNTSKGNTDTDAANNSVPQGASLAPASQASTQTAPVTNVAPPPVDPAAAEKNAQFLKDMGF